MPVLRPRALRRPSCRRPAALLPLAALAALLALPACVTTGGGEPGEPRAEREATTLVVDNQSFLDANIYVLRGSQRIRLGLAGGNTRSRFTIPPNLIFGVTTLQFLADPVGSGRTPVSNEIRITEGEEVRLTIPPR
jgi:hypothetical protein